MWLIWYRILYPFTIGVIMLLIILIYLYRKNKKIQNKIKKEKVSGSIQTQKSFVGFFTLRFRINRVVYRLFIIGLNS